MNPSYEEGSTSGEASTRALAKALGKWVVRLLRAAGWGAAALALVGFAGAINRAADLASHFRVLYLIAMVPALTTYLAESRSRRRRTVLLAILAAFDAWPIAALYLPPGQGSANVPGSGSIRLLQFNTWPKNREDESVLSFIEVEQPDVAALQETTPSLRALLDLRLAVRYEILTAGSELLLIRRDAESIRLRDWSRRQTDGAVQAITARLVVRGRPVRILSLHATAPLSLGRAAARDAQFEWVARWCREQPEPVIVLGDLNATPWSHAFGRLLREGKLSDSTRGFGVQPTWRSRYGPISGWMAWPLQIPIDHCLHSPGLVTLTRSTGPPCGSNHYPLLITLQSSMPVPP